MRMRYATDRCRTDVDAGMVELERVAGQGARFVLLPIGPVGGERSPADPYYDRFWSVVQETFPFASRVQLSWFVLW